MEHTKEPWVVKSGGRYGPVNQPSVGHVLSSGTGKGDEEAHANAARIVAAVNACAGISTEALEAGVVKELVQELQDLVNSASAVNALNIASTTSPFIVGVKRALDLLFRVKGSPQL